MSERTAKVAYGLAAFGFLLLLVGSWWGLFMAPPEQYMGQVERILYVHVPTAWVAMLAFTSTFVCAVAFLVRNRWRWDWWLEASVEVAVVLGLMLCLQGSIWAKPTWGVWWDWDPRLTSTAILVFAFVGVLALRRFVDDPGRRAVWSSVATIIAAVDVPIVYFSVKWWNSLHQLQSNPATVSPAFYAPLRINAFGVLFLAAGMIALRSRIAKLRLERELAPPPQATAPEVVLAALAGTVGAAAGFTGKIHGGWTFVWLAYTATALAFAAYMVSLHYRYRAELRRAARAPGAAAGGISE
jgi:heme exporter protein C